MLKFRLAALVLLASQAGAAPAINLASSSRLPHHLIKDAPKQVKKPTGFHFLHPPKTGTSFIIALRNYLPACRVKDYTCAGVRGGGCWGNQTCADGASEDKPFFDAVEHDQACRGRLPVCTGEHFHSPYMRAFARQPGFAYVAMVREPMAQQVSLLKWHCPDLARGTQQGVPEAELDVLWGDCLQHAPRVDKSSSDYRVYHDIQTKMLLGRSRSVHVLELTANHTQSALSRLLGLDFFGVTERWTETICLFHARFGGQPRPAEFINVRKGFEVPLPAGVEAKLRDNVALDQGLFAAASAEFERRVGAAMQDAGMRRCVEEHAQQQLPPNT